VSLWKAASYAISTRLSFLTIRPSPLSTSRAPTPHTGQANPWYQGNELNVDTHWHTSFDPVYALTNIRLSHSPKPKNTKRLGDI
jgi:hypothetical protein